MEQLEVVLSEIDPDIIILTEHNMNKTDLERFNIPNYFQLANYARTSTTGGGVLILSKESVKGKRLVSNLKNEIGQDKLFEFCYVKIQMGCLSFLLVGIYRTPQFQNSEFLNRLNHLIERLITKEKHLIIIGDLNIDDTLKNSPVLKELKIFF